MTLVCLEITLLLVQVLDRFLRQTVTDLLFIPCNSSIVELWFPEKLLTTAGGNFASQGLLTFQCPPSAHLDTSRMYLHMSPFRTSRLLMFDQCAAFQHVVSKIKRKVVLICADHQARLATALSKTNEFNMQARRRK
eukprot:s185_g8.t1